MWHKDLHIYLDILNFFFFEENCLLLIFSSSYSEYLAFIFACHFLPDSNQLSTTICCFLNCNLLQCAVYTKHRLCEILRLTFISVRENWQLFFHLIKFNYFFLIQFNWILMNHLISFVRSAVEVNLITAAQSHPE